MISINDTYTKFVELFSNEHRIVFDPFMTHQGIGSILLEHNAKIPTFELEQDHRGIKEWYRNMRGFKNIFSAFVLCTVFEEFRQPFKMRGKTEWKWLMAFIDDDFQERLIRQGM